MTHDEYDAMRDYGLVCEALRRVIETAPISPGLDEFKDDVILGLTCWRGDLYWNYIHRGLSRSRTPGQETSE